MSRFAQVVSDDLHCERARNDNQPNPTIEGVCAGEPVVLSRADVSVMTTAADRARVRATYPAAAARALTLPMVPLLNCPRDGGLASRSGLLYIGGNHRTNARSFIWFLKEVLPRLRQRLPGSAPSPSAVCLDVFERPYTAGGGGGGGSPFQCLRLTRKILLRCLRCQEDLSFKFFGPPWGTQGGPPPPPLSPPF